MFAFYISCTQFLNSILCGESNFKVGMVIILLVKKGHGTRITSLTRKEESLATRDRWLRLRMLVSVQKHVKEITEIFNELSVIGDNIEQEDRVVYLLASLPDSYEMLVTALEASENVPTMETVIEHLLHEE